MNKIQEDWCVKLTPELKPILKIYFETFHNKQWDFNGTYYGACSGNAICLTILEAKSLLTRGQFLSKIGYQTDLIPGKWYKIVGPSSTEPNCWRVKFKEIRDNLVKSDGHVNGENQYFNSEGSFGLRGTYRFEEIDISTIQQYLPDGHIDKIKVAYIPQEGNYITTEASDGRKIIEHYINTVDTIRCSGPYISDFPSKNNFQFYTQDSWCHKSSDRATRLATTEEITWLNTCIRAGELVSKEEVLGSKKEEEKWIPKVNDWVTCIDTGLRGGAGWSSGHTFRVTTITNDRGNLILWGGKYGSGVYDSSIRKAYAHEIPRAKSTTPSYMPRPFDTEHLPEVTKKPINSETILEHQVPIIKQVQKTNKRLITI